jgi:hypothetical protein
MLGMFKGIFGKSAEKAELPLSADQLKEKIAEHEARITQLRRQLPDGHAAERAKTEAWFNEMNALLIAAKGKGDYDAIGVVEGKIKEATKKQERIGKHLGAITDQIVVEEEKIELLERQLESLR